jgi:hypothetical protein
MRDPNCRKAGVEKFCGYSPPCRGNPFAETSDEGMGFEREYLIR